MAVLDGSNFGKIGCETLLKCEICSRPLKKVVFATTHCKSVAIW